MVVDLSGNDAANILVLKDWNDINGNDHCWIEILYIFPENVGLKLSDELIKHVTKKIIKKRQLSFAYMYMREIEAQFMHMSAVDSLNLHTPS